MLDTTRPFVCLRLGARFSKRNERKTVFYFVLNDGLSFAVEGIVSFLVVYSHGGCRILLCLDEREVKKAMYTACDLRAVVSWIPRISSLDSDL